MKRLRAEHANSTSVRVHVCEKARAPACAERVGTQQSLADAWRVAPVRPPVVCLERSSVRSDTTARSTAADVIYAVDLFCGLGGWSCGAKQAGYTIALAVDSWGEALKIHKANHPHTAHCRMQLGSKTEEALERLIAKHIPAGARWHLHQSPPCTSISVLHSMNRENNFDGGMDMVMWSLRMVFKLKPTTWSFEQAPEREIMGMLRWLQHMHPDTVRFARVDFAQYGLCQHRIRTLAGSPCLLDPFLTDLSLRADPPMLSEILAPPAEAVWLKSSTGCIPKPHATVAHADGTFTNSSIRRDVRSIHDISWTCVAAHPHAYLGADFKQIREHTPRESATIQSIPLEYAVQPRGCSRATAQRAVGNCVPPLVARLLMGGRD